MCANNIIGTIIKLILYISKSYKLFIIIYFCKTSYELSALTRNEKFLNCLYINNKHTYKLNI